MPITPAKSVPADFQLSRAKSTALSSDLWERRTKSGLPADVLGPRNSTNAGGEKQDAPPSSRPSLAGQQPGGGAARPASPTNLSRRPAELDGRAQQSANDGVTAAELDPLQSAVLQVNAAAAKKKARAAAYKNPDELIQQFDQKLAEITHILTTIKSGSRTPAAAEEISDKAKKQRHATEAEAYLNAKIVRRVQSAGPGVSRTLNAKIQRYRNNAVARDGLELRVQRYLSEKRTDTRRRTVVTPEVDFIDINRRSLSPPAQRTSDPGGSDTESGTTFITQARPASAAALYTLCEPSCSQTLAAMPNVDSVGSPTVSPSRLRHSSNGNISISYPDQSTSPLSARPRPDSAGQALCKEASSPFCSAQSVPNPLPTSQASVHRSPCPRRPASASTKLQQSDTHHRLHSITPELLQSSPHSRTLAESQHQSPDPSSPRRCSQLHMLLEEGVAEVQADMQRQKSSSPSATGRASRASTVNFDTSRQQRLAMTARPGSGGSPSRRAEFLAQRQQATEQQRQHAAQVAARAEELQAERAASARQAAARRELRLAEEQRLLAQAAELQAARDRQRTWVAVTTLASKLSFLRQQLLEDRQVRESRQIMKEAALKIATWWKHVLIRRKAKESMQLVIHLRKLLHPHIDLLKVKLRERAATRIVSFINAAQDSNKATVAVRKFKHLVTTIQKHWRTALMVRQLQQAMLYSWFTRWEAQLIKANRRGERGTKAGIKMVKLAVPAVEGSLQRSRPGSAAPARAGVRPSSRPQSAHQVHAYNRPMSASNPQSSSGLLPSAGASRQPSAAGTLALQFLSPPASPLVSPMPPRPASTLPTVARTHTVRPLSGRPSLPRPSSAHPAGPRFTKPHPLTIQGTGAGFAMPTSGYLDVSFTPGRSPGILRGATRPDSPGRAGTTTLEPFDPDIEAELSQHKEPLPHEVRLQLVVEQLRTERHNFYTVLERYRDNKAVYQAQRPIEEIRLRLLREAGIQPESQLQPPRVPHMRALLPAPALKRMLLRGREMVESARLAELAKQQAQGISDAEVEAAFAAVLGSSAGLSRLSKQHSLHNRRSPSPSGLHRRTGSQHGSPMIGGRNERHISSRPASPAHR